MSLPKWSLLAAIAVAGALAFSGAATADLGGPGQIPPFNCCKCKAVSVNGMVLQTCPCNYNQGGISCDIQHDECETVGECDMG